MNPDGGATAAPVPLRLTVCASFAALETIERVADRVPAADGVKAMVTVQLAPAAKVPPQVDVRMKSPAFVPLTEILLIVSAEVPPLVRVRVAELVVERNCESNETLEAERLSAEGLFSMATTWPLNRIYSLLGLAAFSDPCADEMTGKESHTTIIMNARGAVWENVEFRIIRVIAFKVQEIPIRELLESLMTHSCLREYLSPWMVVGSMHFC